MVHYEGTLSCGDQSEPAAVFWSDVARWPSRWEEDVLHLRTIRQPGGFLVFPGPRADASDVVMPIGPDIAESTRAPDRLTVEIDGLPSTLNVELANRHPEGCRLQAAPTGRSFDLYVGDFTCDESIDADSSFLLVDTGDPNSVYLSWWPSQAEPNRYIIGQLSDGSGSFAAVGIDNRVFEKIEFDFGFVASSNDWVFPELWAVGQGNFKVWTADHCWGQWTGWLLDDAQLAKADAFYDYYVPKPGNNFYRTFSTVGEEIRRLAANIEEGNLQSIDAQLVDKLTRSKIMLETQPVDFAARYRCYYQGGEYLCPLILFRDDAVIAKLELAFQLSGNRPQLIDLGVFPMQAVPSGLAVPRD